MTPDHFTGLLAERIMRWAVGPERFLLGGGKWMRRSRFRPMEKLADALLLLESAAPQEYFIEGDETGITRVRLHIAGTAGEATEASKPRAITFAIARAVGIRLPDEPQPTGPNAVGPSQRGNRGN